MNPKAHLAPRILIMLALAFFTWTPGGKAAPVQTLDLSGTWNFTPAGGAATTIQVPGGGWYKQGFTEITEADYSTSISVPSIGQPQVTVLEFGAVNYQADLFVNEVFVASSVQSFTPATFDITDFVTPGGSHNIRVHVKGRGAFMVGGKSIVPNAAGWSPNTAQGIFRSAKLLVYPRVHISDVFVKPSVSDTSLSYAVWVTNATAATAEVTLSSSLSSWNGDSWSYPTLPAMPVSIPAHTTTKLTVGPVTWNLGPDSYWWPNVPYQAGYTAKLHHLNLSISGDGSHQTSTRFGFRECKQAGDGLGNTCYFLNGVRVNFRGDSLQGANYDSILHGGGPGDAYGTLPGFLPGTNGWPKAVENYQRLNYNVVRIHQQPCTPYMLDVCDEMGLMLIEETAIRGSNNDQDFILGHDHMVNHLKALFTRDRNHPSIVRQSLSNEPDISSTDSTQFQMDLYNAAMSVDGTRPLSVDCVTNAYEAMNYPNFATYRHYGNGSQSGQYTDEVHARPDRPFGQGEFIWYADNTPQGFAWFATSTQAMRAKSASDIRPYALLSAWASVIPGVRTDQMQIESYPWLPVPHSATPLYGEDNLPDPWSNGQFQRVQAAFNPVLVADQAYWQVMRGSNAGGAWPATTPYLAANSAVTRTLRIYNDTFSGPSVEVFWELRQGSPSGTLSASGNFTKPVTPGYTATQDITFMTPNVADGTLLYLVLSTRKGGAEIFRENSQVFVVGQPVVASGIYRIINRNSGLALHAESGLGGNVDQVTPGTATDQRWVVQNIGGDRYYISNVANPRYLDVSGGEEATGDGPDIVVWEANAKSNQKWIIQPASDGYFTIAAAHSGKLLDVYGASTASGGNVVQWTANGGFNQQWSFEEVMPPTPTGLSASSGDGQVNLTWNAASGEVTYNVKRSLTSGTNYATIAEAVSGTTFNDTGVTNGTSYHYVVSATNGIDEGADSAEAVATPSVPISDEELRGGSFAIFPTGGIYTFTSSVLGHTYQLQYSDDLLPGTWQNIGSIRAGTGGDLQFDVPLEPGTPRRFFRILVGRPN
jgi:hypothetical protein